MNDLDEEQTLDFDVSGLDEPIDDQADRDEDSPASFVDNVANAESTLDLDAVLAEWDSFEKKDEPEDDPVLASLNEPVSTPTNGQDAGVLDSLVNWANQRDAQWAAEKEGRDLAETITQAQKEIGRDDVTEKVIESWLRNEANSNPYFARAWQLREQHPDHWRESFVRAVSALRKALPPPSDPDLSNDDRASAMAFVRGSSTKEIPPEPVTDKKLAKMSDQEFNKHQKTLGINP